MRKLFKTLFAIVIIFAVIIASAIVIECKTDPNK